MTLPAVRLELLGAGEAAAFVKSGPMEPWIPRFVQRVANRLRNAMSAIAPRGKERRVHPLSRRAPRRGHLAENISILRNVNPADGWKAHADVGPANKFQAVGRYLVDGTRAHWIIARRAKVLTIPGGAALGKRGLAAALRGVKGKARSAGKAAENANWRLVRKVWHPGTAKNNFVLRASQSISAADISADWQAAVASNASQATP